MANIVPVEDEDILKQLGSLKEIRHKIMTEVSKLRKKDTLAQLGS